MSMITLHREKFLVLLAAATAGAHGHPGGLVGGKEEAIWKEKGVSI